MKITLALVIDALEHSSDKQEQEFLRQLERGVDSWAGIVLGDMVKDFIESIEEDDGPTQTELDTEAGFKRGE